MIMPRKLLICHKLAVQDLDSCCAVINNYLASSIISWTDIVTTITVL